MTRADDDFVEANRGLWDRWADLHVGTEFYDVEGFVRDPASRPLDRIVRGVVGDVSGARLLHLQCHFGMDTLRLALMGAEVTGVDFSSAAVAHARALAARMGIPARFVVSDVCALPPADVPLGAFDVVFTSYGAITWLPDLRPWAASIASRLAPGGVFHVIEMHPFLWVLDEEVPEPPPPLRYAYFGREAVRFEEHGSYADPEADVHGESYSWQHTFEEVVGSLLAEGLVIESLREYPYVAWRHMPYLVEDGENLWRMPESGPDVPLMFSISARKPA